MVSVQISLVEAGAGGADQQTLEATQTKLKLREYVIFLVLGCLLGRVWPKLVEPCRESCLNRYTAATKYNFQTIFDLSKCLRRGHNDKDKEPSI